MAEQIFTPLGMNDSAAFNLLSKECPLQLPDVRLSPKQDGFGIRCDLNFLDGVFGDGGIYSSAERPCALGPRAARRHADAGCEVYQQAYVSGRLNSGDATGYGFGWEIQPPDVVDHWGEWEGFSAYLRRDLRRQQPCWWSLSNSGPAGRGRPDLRRACGIRRRAYDAGAAGRRRDRARAHAAFMPALHDRAHVAHRRRSTGVSTPWKLVLLHDQVVQDETVDAGGEEAFHGVVRASRRSARP